MHDATAPSRGTAGAAPLLLSLLLLAAQPAWPQSPTAQGRWIAGGLLNFCSDHLILPADAGDNSLATCSDVTYPDWETSAYVLPYPVGTSYLVIQENCGRSTHRGRYRFAYDWLMPIGSTVVAARGGQVINAEDGRLNFNGRGNGINAVRILHDDGTTGTYLHLTQFGALVQVGDVVAQGEPIALSGASGLNLGDQAHLHFIVRQDRSRAADSLPTTFRNTFANPQGLQRNTEYPALPY